MGQRGSKAVFMPDKFVFPGGAIDAIDMAPQGEWQLETRTAQNLLQASSPETARALPFTAIRELREEAGLVLGRPAGAGDDPSQLAEWGRVFVQGFMPDLAALRLIFRAVTPPGRVRRFDARFFYADAARIDPEWSDAGDGELRSLQWFAIDAARRLDLPFITGVVLSELEAVLRSSGDTRRVPYFQHEADGSHFRLL